jgi:hypothetical protein
MISALVKTFRAIAVVATVVIAPVAGGAHAQPARANDTARLLAGMPPSPDSPLLVMTRDRGWQQHANNFNSIFAKVENRKLTRIQTWSRAKLKTPSPVLFYMFSGPDFLYANAFFPSASTYVMSGLEPTGPVPDLTRLSREARARGFRNIEQSLSSIATYGFFQTIDMRRNLATASLTGTLPIIYVFLARSGKTIRDVSLIRLDENGTAQVDDQAESGAGSARGVKIDFIGDDGRPQTLYYFNVNIDNDGFGANGFARFCEHLGTGDALVKSASYLMHRPNFSNVRSFLLDHTRLILQDDSGILVSRFDQASWQLRPFGHYSGPIALFANRYQAKLSQLFNRRGVESIDFGIGYRWHSQSSNLIVATRTSDATPGAVAATQPSAISGEAHSKQEAASDKKSAETGADNDKHKTADRSKSHNGSKSHHGSKYATRSRLGGRTRRWLAHGAAPQPFWFADW